MYSSPHIHRMIKSRSMRWVGHVVRVGEIRNAYKFWSENLKERKHLEDLGVGGRIKPNIRIDLWEGGG